MADCRGCGFEEPVHVEDTPFSFAFRRGGGARRSPQIFAFGCKYRGAPDWGGVEARTPWFRPGERMGDWEADCWASKTAYATAPARRLLLCRRRFAHMPCLLSGLRPFPRVSFSLLVLHQGGGASTTTGCYMSYLHRYKPFLLWLVMEEETSWLVPGWLAGGTRQFVSSWDVGRRLERTGLLISVLMCRHSNHGTRRAGPTQ